MTACQADHNSSLTASIARLLIYVQLIQAALDHVSIDQDRQCSIPTITELLLTFINRGHHIINVVEHARIRARAHSSMTINTNLSLIPSNHPSKMFEAFSQCARARVQQKK